MIFLIIEADRAIVHVVHSAVVNISSPISMVLRPWALTALGLLSLALIATGYWLWRPVPQLHSYIPTNSHLIIGFGSDYLHSDVSNIGQVPLGTWRQQLLDYISNQVSGRSDSIEAVMWATDATATEQTTAIQFKSGGLSKKQQASIRAQLVGQPTPVLGFVWNEVFFDGPIVVVTTMQGYQPPKEKNALAYQPRPSSMYLLWDQVWPQSLLDIVAIKDFSFIGQEKEGQIHFDSRNSLRRLIVRLPLEDNVSSGTVALPPTERFQVYLAGQTEKISLIKDFPVLKPWYEALETSIGQKYGLSLDTTITNFGTSLIFLLNEQQWLVQSSTSSLQQVANAMSGYLQPTIKRGTLPDGSTYRELVRSEGQSSTTTIAGQSIRVWSQGLDQAIYQFDQAGRSIITNNSDLLGLSLEGQEANGLWLSCLPPEKLIWTDIVWLQNTLDSGSSTLAALPEPWKAAGMLSGRFGQYQEYIFCLL